MIFYLEIAEEEGVSVLGKVVEGSIITHLNGIRNNYFKNII